MRNTFMRAVKICLCP